MKELTYRLPQQRHITGELPGSISAALTKRREAAVASPLQPGLPGFITDADGGVLIDADGNSFIDFASGIAVTSVGASNPAVAEAVSTAVAKFTHTCFMVSPYESYVAVAEKLNELTPGDHDKKTVLLNSGAEAVENAVKIARAYTSRNAVVVFDYGYHGRTNLTMAMTAKNLPYKDGFGPFASEVYRAPMSYPLRDGLTGNQAAQRAITMMEQQVGAHNIACVVIEPIQGEGGFIVPALGFLAAISDWCKTKGVVFVADEIQAGFARTGCWFAIEHEQVVPDLITAAKGIAGGMPLSAVTGRAEIMDAPVKGGLGGTYGGNPVACAAALAAIGQIEKLELNQRAQDIEHVIREEFAPLESIAAVAEVRGRGAMVALELVTADGKPNAELTAEVAALCKTQGLLILTCGLDSNVIRLLPPLVIPETLLREGLSLVREAIISRV